MLFCELLVTGVLQTKTAELLLRNQWWILGRGPANSPPPYRGAPTQQQQQQQQVYSVLPFCTGVTD